MKDSSVYFRGGREGVNDPTWKVATRFRGIVRAVTILEAAWQTQLPEHVGEVGGTPKLAINAS